MASMHCTFWRCGSAQQCGYFFNVAIHEFHSIWRWIRWATRCAQVTQLLAAAWAQHSNENPLVVIQLDIVNTYPSADQQAQFEVLPGRASKSCDNEHVQIGDAIHCPSSLYHYWSCFESMQGTASNLHFNDYLGLAHKIACSKGCQHWNGAFQVLQLQLSPRFGKCLLVTLLAPGPSWCLHCCSTCRKSCSCSWAQPGTEAGSWHAWSWRAQV